MVESVLKIVFEINSQAKPNSWTGCYTTLVNDNQIRYGNNMSLYIVYRYMF